MRSLFFFLMMLLTLPLLWAEDSKGIFSVQVENDLFGGGSDRHYTHGTRISYLTAKAPPEWATRAAEYLPFFESDGDLRFSLVMGQSMFTPEKIWEERLIQDDRPYAGWLYGGIGLVSDKRTEKRNGLGGRLDTLELNIGIIGQDSLVDDTQSFVHEIVDAPKPKGWRHQLDNELGIVLTYDRQWQIPYQKLHLDITPHVGGALGNVYTYLSAGITVRFGKNLERDYGPPRIRPSLPGSGFFKPEKKISWYVFAGVGGRLVARNIFLDGNTFSDSHSVDKKYLVGDAQVGLVLMLGPAQVSFTNIFRTAEFEGQKELDEFGAISISFPL